MDNKQPCAQCGSANQIPGHIREIKFAPQQPAEKLYSGAGMVEVRIVAIACADCGCLRLAAVTEDLREALEFCG